MVNVYDEIRKGERGAWVSIIAYLILSAFKLISGYIFASSALLVPMDLTTSPILWFPLPY